MTDGEGPRATAHRGIIVAVDLEGTLVSNAVSVFPRPGLDRFLGELRRVADEVVLFTAVQEKRAREVITLLAEEGTAPPWFAAVRILTSPTTKDLERVADLDAATVLLVDDQSAAVAPGQEGHWIEATPFEAPYDQADSELDEVLQRILSRLGRLSG